SELGPGLNNVEYPSMRPFGFRLLRHNMPLKLTSAAQPHGVSPKIELNPPSLESLFRNQFGTCLVTGRWVQRDRQALAGRLCNLAPRRTGRIFPERFGSPPSVRAPTDPCRRFLPLLPESTRRSGKPGAWRNRRIYGRAFPLP